MRAPCLTSENQKPRHKAGPGIFLWNFIFIVVVFVYQSTKYTLAKFSILKFNTKTARLSGLVTKHWKLRSYYAQNQETNHAFFSVVHNCLSGNRKTLEQTGIRLVCVLCACTHDRNQTETSGSNNNKNKDRWSGMEIRRRKRTCSSTCSSVKELGSLLLRHIESSLGPKASNSYGLEKQCNAATACCTIFSYILFFMVVFCHSPCCCWPFAYPSRTEPENAEPDCSCILVSCVRSLSLSPSLARAGGDWAGLVKGGLSMCVGNLTGFVGFPVKPRCLTRPGPACSGFSVPRRNEIRRLSLALSVRKVLAVFDNVFLRFYIGHFVCTPLSRPKVPLHT